MKNLIVIKLKTISKSFTSLIIIRMFIYFSTQKNKMKTFLVFTRIYRFK